MCCCLQYEIIYCFAVAASFVQLFQISWEQDIPADVVPNRCPHPWIPQILHTCVQIWEMKLFDRGCIGK
jgi:hypothetical protein